MQRRPRRLGGPRGDRLVERGGFPGDRRVGRGFVQPLAEARHGGEMRVERPVRRDAKPCRRPVLADARELLARQPQSDLVGRERPRRRDALLRRHQSEHGQKQRLAAEARLRQRLVEPGAACGRGRVDRLAVGRGEDRVALVGVRESIDRERRARSEKPRDRLALDPGLLE